MADEMHESDVLEAFGHNMYSQIKKYVQQMDGNDVDNVCNHNAPNEQYTYVNRGSFKSYKYRLIACNGDCGSVLAKFIAYCAGEDIVCDLCNIFLVFCEQMSCVTKTGMAT